MGRKPHCCFGTYQFVKLFIVCGERCSVATQQQRQLLLHGGAVRSLLFSTVVYAENISPWPFFSA